MRTAAAILAAICALVPSAASADHLIDAGDQVPGHRGVTYLSLVRQAVPDLANNPTSQQIEGHLAASPRHLAGKDFEGGPPDPMVLGFIEDQRFRAGGKRRIAILADFGMDPDRAQSMTLLMLFDDAARPRLLDVVDVGVDKDTSFAERPKLPLGAGDDALVTYSEHFNSSQTYGAHLVALVRHDRFRLIRNIFTLSSRGCSWEEQQRLTLNTAPDSGSPYRAVDVTVRVVTTRTGDACGDDELPKPRKAAFHTLFRWNAAKRRFESSSRALDRLWKINQSNF